MPRFGGQPNVVRFAVLPHTITSDVLPRRDLLVGGAPNHSNDPALDGFRFRCYYYITMAWYVTTLLCGVAYSSHIHRPRGRTVPDRGQAPDAGLGGLLSASLGPRSLMRWPLGSQNPYRWSDVHVSTTFVVSLALALVLIVYVP